MGSDYIYQVKLLYYGSLHRLKGYCPQFTSEGITLRVKALYGPLELITNKNVSFKLSFNNELLQSHVLKLKKFFLYKLLVAPEKERLWPFLPRDYTSLVVNSYLVRFFNVVQLL